jgi:hypothetical protein
MDLRKSVLDYYLANFSLLSDDKQFHFATRCAAWNGDKRCQTHLERIRAQLVPDPLTAPALKASLAELIKNPPEASINAATARAPFFARYPQLRGIDFALFRVRHLGEVYGIDARSELLELISEKQLRDLQDALMQDSEAIKVLSTYAINYLYLLHKVLFEDDALHRTRFLEIGKDYRATDATQLQLLIYLYTHCIIGETNFYAQNIPAKHMPLYRTMLEQLESHIADNFDAINLDNKLEFMVCCQICQYDTKLRARIDEECQQSVSEDGMFIIDRHNSNRQSSKSSFEASEHRNVLFIMSGTAYHPHSTRV